MPSRSITKLSSRPERSAVERSAVSSPFEPWDLQSISNQESLSASKCSATRIALAMIVNDGFTALADTKQEASTT
jgi:hypothetical protein